MINSKDLGNAPSGWQCCDNFLKTCFPPSLRSTAPSPVFSWIHPTSAALQWKVRSSLQGLGYVIVIWCRVSYCIFCSTQTTKQMIIFSSKNLFRFTQETFKQEEIMILCFLLLLLSGLSFIPANECFVQLRPEASSVFEDGRLYELVVESTVPVPCPEEASPSAGRCTLSLQLSTNSKG